ncbi:MAG: dienelactone hydrolase family protein [Pseudomonadota bacterium]
MDSLQYVEVETGNNIDATVIWLHGLGANGHDFEPIVPVLRLPDTLGIRFIFPHAPAIPVTINQGMVMPAWYDISSLELGRQVDETQLRASAAQVAALADQEITRGIAAERIIIAGFSQGGAVGFEMALSFSKPLAGLLAMSTYFATASTIEPNPANRELPILIQHGTMDPMVSIEFGQDSYRLLTEMGYPAEFVSYKGQHEVVAPQIKDVRDWFVERLT